MYLNTHSWFSFKYGTIPTNELLVEAKKNDIDTLALTDINCTAASLNFVRLANKTTIKPVVGVDFRNGAKQKFIGLAQNNEGFKNLNAYLSKHLHAEKDFPNSAPVLPHTFFIYPFKYFKGNVLNENEYLGVSPADLNHLLFSSWKNTPEKLVVLQTVTFRNKKDFNAHRLLRAIDKNTLLSKLPKTEEGDIRHIMFPKASIESIYKDYPELIKNTKRLLSDCKINFTYGNTENKNQRTYTGSEKEDYRLLSWLCYENLSYRYKNPQDKIFKRLEMELDIIRKKGFISYFLINWDIVNYAKRKNYFYIGRGSGANSIVAYLLRITDVDPIELDLYFERFINLYRQNPPDFDIDFSWKDREDITNYIFSRFKNVALLATYSTFKFKAVSRELGKVFGLPPHEIDALIEGSVQNADHHGKLVLKYGHLIDGFPSHLSIHAGGILISEKPIHYYTATSLPPKGFPTTHFDMVVAEDIGLYKFDILSQRGLSKITETLNIIERQEGSLCFDIHDMQFLKKDPQIKKMLRKAQAIGCFYVESPAMRMLLKKLEAGDYLGLVAASSIIRPGVAKSGMMREYILRFRQPERRKEAHPVMLDIMPDTFGVMVYQEDVIKVAHYFAGLTLAEADVLRRGMSGKYRSRAEFQKVKDKYFKNCAAKGIEASMAREVWRQIESFAGYAFSKGHSASYAVESFQSLFLKAYYPLEYMVATINNFGGFYRTELYVHEAIMHGGNVMPPCVNRSGMETKIYGKDIYLGFVLVKDLEQRVIEQFVLEKSNHGKFTSLENFVKRVSISLEQLSIIIRIGGFRFTGVNKKELLWKAHFMLGKNKRSSPGPKLFDVDYKQFKLPRFSVSLMEDAFEEMELIGFPLCSPFSLLRGELKSTLCVKDFEKHAGKEISIAGYLVAIKNTKTSKSKRMNFGTFLDLEGHFIDTVHFPPVAAKYPFRGKGLYTLTGKVVEEFNFYCLEVTMMEKERYIDDPRYFGEDNIVL